eukprot:s1576_g14.t1
MSRTCSMALLFWSIQMSTVEVLELHAAIAATDRIDSNCMLQTFVLVCCVGDIHDFMTSRACEHTSVAAV